MSKVNLSKVYNLDDYDYTEEDDLFTKKNRCEENKEDSYLKKSKKKRNHRRSAQLTILGEESYEGY